MALEREYNERVKASYNKGACIKYLMVKKYSGKMIAVSKNYMKCRISHCEISSGKLGLHDYRRCRF